MPDRLQQAITVLQTRFGSAAPRPAQPEHPAHPSGIPELDALTGIGGGPGGGVGPLAGPLAARLDAIERAVAPQSDPSGRVLAATLAEFRGKRWVTRPRPHVDRLACAWLIRRFIDPHAAIRYAATPEPGEIAFDMSGARFGHQGSRCTFETLLAAFSLDEPALRAMAAIVHEIDLREGKYHRPESAGIEAALSGWWMANYSDAEHEAHGIALFEGLYLSLAHPHGAHISSTTKNPATTKRKPKR